LRIFFGLLYSVSRHFTLRVTDLAVPACLTEGQEAGEVVGIELLTSHCHEMARMMI
jgi:hypothetical protein